MSVIEQFGLQMPEDVSFFKNEDALVRLRHAAIYDYRTAPELDDHFIQCSSHLSQNPFVSLVRGIDAGDGEKVLDIGLRYAVKSIFSTAELTRTVGISPAALYENPTSTALSIPGK